MIKDDSSVAILCLSVVSYVAFVLSLFVHHLLLFVPQEGCAVIIVVFLGYLQFHFCV